MSGRKLFVAPSLSRQSLLFGTPGRKSHTLVSIWVAGIPAAPQSCGEGEPEAGVWDSERTCRIPHPTTWDPGGGWSRSRRSVRPLPPAPSLGSGPGGAAGEWRGGGRSRTEVAEDVSCLGLQGEQNKGAPTTPRNLRLPPWHVSQPALVPFRHRSAPTQGNSKKIIYTYIYVQCE